MAELPELEDYAVINGMGTSIDTALNDLVFHVRAAMKMGWIPQGGVMYLGQLLQRGEPGAAFSQAMVKPARPQEKESD